MSKTFRNGKLDILAGHRGDKGLPTETINDRRRTTAERTCRRNYASTVTALQLRVLALVALLLATVPARAADIRIEGDGAISVSGDFVAADGATFQKVVSQTKVPSQDIMVFLNSQGGDAATVISIGDYIHHTGMATTVLPGTECVSTCALIWLGGAHRFASKTSKIAFHGLYNGYTLEVDQKLAVSYAIVGAYFAHLGIGYDGIIWMMSPPPGTANSFSFDKAKELGVEVASWEDLVDAANKLARAEGTGVRYLYHHYRPNVAF